MVSLRRFMADMEEGEREMLARVSYSPGELIDELGRIHSSLEWKTDRAGKEQLSYAGHLAEELFPAEDIIGELKKAARLLPSKEEQINKICENLEKSAIGHRRHAT